MKLIVRTFTTPQPYEPIWRAMRTFVDNRTPDTLDELWLLQHEPVFTLGQAGKIEHVLDPHGIPLQHVDRGGQVTYHGPGQLMAYCLFDVNRLKLNTRDFVCRLEKSVIALIADYGHKAYADRDAPGVYIDGAKIAALGLRLRHGYSYHGLCLNIEGDLTPFEYINPCGVKNQKVTQMRQLGISANFDEISHILRDKIAAQFDYEVHCNTE